MPERFRFNRRDPLPEGCRLVARPSRWGNPWQVGVIADVIADAADMQPKAGTPEGALLDVWPESTAQAALRRTANELAVIAAVSMFRTLAESFRGTDPAGFAEWIGPLIGHDLACYCRLDSPCHADVLLEIANV